MSTAVIYEGTPGVRLHTEGLTIVGSTLETLVETATALVERGVDTIELCGGLGSADAEPVLTALAGRARVGLARYGFESLELVAAFKQAWGAGEPTGQQVFLYGGAADAERVEHADATIVPVESIAHAERIGAQLAEQRAGLVELYGGLGLEHAAAVVRGSGGAVPVGFVGYDG